jgi:putative transposase/transposase-like zinc-binding protein
VADIFRQYGPQYRQSHRLPRTQRRVMEAIEDCRTSALGGHKDKCDRCSHIEIFYNSCRNRHCPKCQFLRKEKWIDARTEDLLPVRYFHVVFTIPTELKPLVLRNQKVMYGILFRSVSETLLELANNPKHLGARIGFMGILHTWGQNLMDHPHVHCVVPGGGLSPDGNHWVSSRKQFFIHVKVMAKLFKEKFRAYLKRSYQSGELLFPDGISHLNERYVFERLRRLLYHKKWVVYCKPPFNGAEGVFEYLSRYTHRIAISNNRILKVEDGKVSFLWRDYADNDTVKTMTVEADEFIRRFLLHVLPDGFVKIRYYGLLANRTRKGNIALCRELLGESKIETRDNDVPETWQEHFLRVSGVDVTTCPVCKKGRLITVEILYPSWCHGPPMKYGHGL